jgi:hypothetical protein
LDFILPLFGGLALVLAFLIWRRRGPRKPTHPVILDGSNVMYWRDNTPQVATVQDVLRKVTELGYQPGIMFDASAGYGLAGRYLDDRDFAQLFRLPENRVIVVHKGTVADEVILQAARDLDARIVTNDRYRDWQDRFPEIATPGHLVRGGYRRGRLWLDLDPVGG